MNKPSRMLKQAVVSIMIAAILFISPSGFAQGVSAGLQGLKDRADMLLYSNRVEAALVIYREIVAKAPDFANCHYNMAICYTELKQFDKAYAALVRFVTFKPNDSEAYFNLGILKVYMGKEFEAKMFFKKALSLGPSPELREKIQNALDHLTPSAIPQNSLEAIKNYLGERND